MNEATTKTAVRGWPRPWRVRSPDIPRESEWP